MSLENKINQEIKSAMLAKNDVRLTTLRAIKSALLLAKTEKGAEAEISEEQEIKILQRLSKQRKDSAQIYREQNREDLLQIEEAEWQIIQEFLPTQMSPEEIKTTIRNLLVENQLQSMKDMGKAMGIANKALVGKAEGKLIADIVKEILSV